MGKRALILVDVQPDFMPGGALAVPGGDEILPVADRLRRLRGTFFDLVVATQDWHPRNHGSFADVAGVDAFSTFDLNGVEQVAWPRHCVQGSQGAAIDPRLGFAGIDTIIKKGTNPEVDSYSGFFDNARRGDTGLHAYLQSKGVDELVVIGLATDYCVRFTVLDALELGYGVTVVREGCRAIAADGGVAAKAEMAAKGAKVVDEREIGSAGPPTPAP